MIESIFIAASKGATPTAVGEVELVAGRGIVGDRNYDQARWPGQNITFVEAEAVDAFNARYVRTVSAADTRRNVITRSVSLSALVGRQFRIGDVVFRGVELCEPCSTLGARLATGDMRSAEIVRAWVHKGGLRADVLGSGVIRVGMTLIEV